VKHDASLGIDAGKLAKEYPDTLHMIPRKETVGSIPTKVEPVILEMHFSRS